MMDVDVETSHCRMTVFSSRLSRMLVAMISRMKNSLECTSQKVWIWGLFCWLGFFMCDVSISSEFCKLEFKGHSDQYSVSFRLIFYSRPMRKSDFSTSSAALDLTWKFVPFDSFPSC